MSIVIRTDSIRFSLQCQEFLHRLLPGRTIWAEADDSERETVEGEEEEKKKSAEYLCCWGPVSPTLGTEYPNLKGIFSLGAGVDHLGPIENVPSHLPVVRLVDPNLTNGMSEYVLMHTLMHHRGVMAHMDAQKRSVWAPEFSQVPAHARTVGVMGLGVLGGDAAQKLALMGFKVRGWARTPKVIEGVETFHGAEFVSFLDGLDGLISLLPRTPETTGILNATTFSHLKKGAFVISVGRGAHLVEEDLLEALESGQIGAVTLDVFQTEPLPSDHPFWNHPRIFVTPHTASVTNLHSATEIIAHNIQMIERGKTPNHCVNRGHGY
jgi:glyoxylate/hydroxypyruvate reductase